MNRLFYCLWLSYLISQVGDWLYMIALPLEVYRITDSSFHMASLYGVEFLPWIVFSIFGGVLADKLNKKRLLVVGNLLSALFCGLLTVLVYQQEINLPLVYISVFLLASINPLTHPAFQSLLPSLVQEFSLVQANSAMQLIENFISFLGPLVGGTVIAFISGANALLIDAVSFVIAMGLILMIQYDHTTSVRSNKRNLGQEISDGLKYVGANRVILFGSILFFFTNFAIHLFQSNFMYCMTDMLKYSSAVIGLTIGLQGVGPILGAFIAPFFIKRVPSGRLILMSTAFAGLATFGLLYATSFWQIALVQTVVMACGNINVITYFSLRQKVVPKELLGPVVSVTRMISYTSIPIAAFLGGAALSNGWSIYAIISVTAVIRMAVGLGGFLTPSARGNTNLHHKQRHQRKAKDSLWRESFYSRYTGTSP